MAINKISFTDWAGDAVEFSAGGGSFFIEITPGNDSLVQLSYDDLEALAVWATARVAEAKA